MKRRELLSHLQEHGCQLLREGASHSLWINPMTGRREAVPWRQEIKRHLARSICRNLSVEVPKGARPAMTPPIEKIETCLPGLFVLRAPQRRGHRKLMALRTARRARWFPSTEDASRVGAG